MKQLTSWVVSKKSKHCDEEEGECCECSDVIPESSPKHSIGELLEGFEVLTTSSKHKDKNLSENFEGEINVKDEEGDVKDEERKMKKRNMKRET
jgi:hypothetical protein